MQLVCNAGFCRWVPTSDLHVEWQGEQDKESDAKLETSVKFVFLQLPFHTGEICLLLCGQDSSKFTLM